jgi:hypothetical protein
MALAFESGMQNLVYQMDQGAGRKVIHAALFALFAFALAALYTFTNFQGLRDARAMEEAQLARNVAEHGRLVTQCVRPFALGRLAARSPDGAAAALGQPDLLHPPVWPAILAGTFKLVGLPRPGTPTTAYVNGMDYVPVAASHFFTALAAILVWLLGGKLFDHRVGVLAACSFLLSDLAWSWSLLGSGLSAATFFALGAVYAGVWAAEVPPGTDPGTASASVARWLAPLGLAALLTAAAFLTRYATGIVALTVVFLHLGASRQRRPWTKAALFAVLAVLPAIPWMARNVALCGRPFGFIFHQLLAGTYLFPGDAFARTLAPVLPDAGTVFYALQIKMIANLRTFFAQGFGLASGGLVLALFGAMYLHRFVRHASRTLRWCLLPAGGIAILNAAAFGEESLRALAVFWPLAVPYGWAFFLVLLDRLQFEVRAFASAAITALLFLTALPLLAHVLPPRSGLPYPPYFHGYVGWVTGMLEPEECLTTDIPWATAWYGGRTSILLPRDIDGFYQIAEKHQRIALAYFTTLTRDKPWVRGLSDPTAPEYTWYQVFAAGKVPGNFPLTHGRFLAGSDQLVLADRQRW